jgi:hypothetical protein
MDDGLIKCFGDSSNGRIVGDQSYNVEMAKSIPLDFPAKDIITCF